MVLARRWARLGFYPVYVLFFPFLALFLIGRALYRLFQIPFQTGRFLSSTRAALILFVIATIAWAFSFGLNSIDARAVCSLIGHTATFLLLIQFFRWAANPYRPLTAAGEFFSDKITPYLERSFIAPGLAKNGQARQNTATQCEWILKGIDRLQPPGPAPERGVTGFATARLVPLAISLFLVAYVTLAVSFALVFMNTQAAWGSQIAGLGARPTFGDYLYLTLLAQATVVAPPVEPVTHFGQFLIAWPVLTGVLLLTLLIALFTTSIGVHGETAITTLKQLVAAERKRYADWLDALRVTDVAPTPVIEGQFIDVPKATDDG